MHPQSTFEVLTDSGAERRRTWRGALDRLFRTCRELTASMNADIRASIISEPFCARSNILWNSEFAGLATDVQAVMNDYPLEVSSPFEGVSTISGGIWLGSEFCEPASADALLKLRFESGTVDLPVHSHDHSDRVILVADGTAVFELYSEGLPPRKTESVEIAAGDAIVFCRKTVHTFKVPNDDLILLSYHSPFIPLDDPRQYTVIEQR